jgi:hypothetical protein
MANLEIDVEEEFRREKEREQALKALEDSSHTR